MHRRTWQVSRGRVGITDDVLGDGRHRVESRLHLDSAGVGTVVWSGPDGLVTYEGRALHARGFGSVRDGVVRAATWDGELPLRMSAELQFDDPLVQRSVATAGNAETVKGIT